MGGFSSHRNYIGWLCFFRSAPYIGLTDNEPNTVKRVIDGDTIQMGNGTRVRLIGVDTPETVHPEKPVEYFGKEASAFTRRMVEGKRVRLEFDPANTLLDNKDRYGRTHNAQC
jgi:endonuclease YncB( thermonuclease family)